MQKRNGAESVRARALRLVYPARADRPTVASSRLLRAGEVAAILQVSRRSVATWARNGLIPYIETPGGHRRFRAADVRALVSSLEHAAQVFESSV